MSSAISQRIAHQRQHTLHFTAMKPLRCVATNHAPTVDGPSWSTFCRKLVSSGTYVKQTRGVVSQDNTGSHCTTVSTRPGCQGSSVSSRWIQNVFACRGDNRNRFRGTREPSSIVAPPNHKDMPRSQSACHSGCIRSVF